ncbi:hypothetical protein CHUAL_008493 [Chamberlinius hualienensis]
MSTQTPIYTTAILTTSSINQTQAPTTATTISTQTPIYTTAILTTSSTVQTQEPTSATTTSTQTPIHTTTTSEQVPTTESTTTMAATEPQTLDITADNIAESLPTLMVTSYETDNSDTFVTLPEMYQTENAQEEEYMYITGDDTIISTETGTEVRLTTQDDYSVTEIITSEMATAVNSLISNSDANSDDIVYETIFSDSEATEQIIIEDTTLSTYETEINISEIYTNNYTIVDEPLTYEESVTDEMANATNIESIIGTQNEGMEDTNDTITVETIYSEEEG